MSLSIVTPSRNPETLFFTNIQKVLQEKPHWHVILVDDGSDIELRNFLPAAPNLTILRNEISRGAGACRNMAIELLRGDYTVFLDDDDFMDWQVVEQLIAQLEAQPVIDMAISSYSFLNNGRPEPAHPHDQRILDRILGKEQSRVVILDGHEDLLRLTNFPWNKVYRTSFIRRIGLRFSETIVQNDIHAHWQSLLDANRILVTNALQCTKVDNDSGARVSNTSDNRRLQAFTALRETYDLVRKSHLPRAEQSFWAFYHALVRWMLDVSQPDARPALMHEHVSFASIMPPAMIGLEQSVGTKNWEIWNMSNLSDMISDKGTEMAPDILLTEISRLKHLAAGLHEDNDRLRANINHLRNELNGRSHELRRRQHDVDRLNHDITQLNREVNSKAARIAIRIRTFYRSFVPGRRTTQR